MFAAGVMKGTTIAGRFAAILRLCVPDGISGTSVGSEDESDNLSSFILAPDNIKQAADEPDSYAGKLQKNR